ncbi:MAG: MOSC domain-containing protein, partial [Pseudomonadota bacterium]
PTLSQLWRHPIKAIGREALASVTLSPGEWMPNDRVWAVSHERSRLSGTGWEKKINFLRGVTDPALMSVTSTLDEANQTITFTHPGKGSITIQTEENAQPFIDWISAIWSRDLPAPTGLYRATDASLTDVPDPWISVACLASNRALSQRMGTELSPDRWRANLWLEGTVAWEEKEWIGKTIRIGDASLQVKCEITRCKATMANPLTGRRDADTLGALHELGHQEFGLYAEVTSGGTIRAGDTVVVE